jgi:hypothetical protein
MPTCGRRQFLASSAVIAFCPKVSAADELRSRPAESPSEVARNKNFWAAVAAQYDVDRTVTNLQNAYLGIMARPVETAYGTISIR